MRDDTVMDPWSGDAIVLIACPICTWRARRIVAARDLKDCQRLLQQTFQDHAAAAHPGHPVRGRSATLAPNPQHRDPTRHGCALALALLALCLGAGVLAWFVFHAWRY